MRLSTFRFEVENLHFAEAPRWRAGRLWFSDIFGNRVLRHDPGRSPTVIAELPGDRPSGLGWLPDGSTLVVGMVTATLYRVTAGGDVTVHADLGPHVRGMPNDMVVADDGTAYVGDTGLPRFGRRGERQTGQLLRVTADGAVDQVADGLEVPNGPVLTPDGCRLIVAESYGERLTGFEIGGGGELGDGSVYAALEGGRTTDEPVHPDGICLDSEAAVWVADLTTRQVLRVRPGGEVAERISFDPLIPIACVLGGPDRRTLFVCTSEHIDPAKLSTTTTSRIAAVPVTIPGAGTP